MNPHRMLERAGRRGLRLLHGLAFVATLVFALAPAGCERGATPSSPAARPADPDVAAIHAEFRTVGERLYQGNNEFLGIGPLRAWQAKLAGDLPVDQRAIAHAATALEMLRLGQVDDAVAEVERGAALLDQLPAPLQLEILRIRGVAWLRVAEVRNCIEQHNRDCCILPLRGGGVHSVDDPATRARACFAAYLQRQPNDFTIVWLLNVASMAVGDYPQGVPQRWRIPPEAFQDDAPVKRFVNVAPQLGVDAVNLCGGVIAEDFDNDGLIDIITSTFDPLGPLIWYRNMGDGTFTDVTSGSGLDAQLGGLNCVGADYDNDGDVDILVLRGAWLLDDGAIRNSLLRNNGDGTFTDVSRSAGIAAPARPSQAAVWGDFDNDGDLDCYVVNESRLPHGGPSHPSQLLRNNGDGTFDDVAAAAGVTNDRFGKGVAAGDYDDDGDLDLYVSNLGPNRLYRNRGDGTFDDVAPSLGVTEPEGYSFATWFFDADGDGHLDLFVGAFEAKLPDLVRDLVAGTLSCAPPRLYRNRGNGTFEDITQRAGLAHAWLPMGANFGDIDNDGWLDIYLATGEPPFESIMPNVLLRNRGDGTFQNATWSAGLGHLQKGHGVAFADFDQDGDQDLFNQLGGFYPGDAFANALFANPGHGGRFITVRLVGRQSNRQAIGVRLTLTVQTPSGTRRLHRAVGSVSSFGGSPMRQEIGLGDATAITALELWWPASGTRQRLEDVPLDSFIRIEEGSESFEVLDVQSFSLGEG